MLHACCGAIRIADCCRVFSIDGPAILEGFEALQSGPEEVVCVSTGSIVEKFFLLESYILADS
jgi:hypothetical protein